MSARVGIDLGGTKIQGVLMDSDGQVLKSRRIATPRDDYDGTLKAIGALVKSLDASERATVGIGTPGSWRRDLGAMQNCNSTWLNGRPLLPDLEVLLGPRVRMANDADCFALSESRAGGSAAGVSVVFGAILGTGVGGGIVVDGRLLQGVNSLTGEWGHTPLPNFGEQADEAALGFRGCYCGRRNCVETFLSGPGLARTHVELWNEPLEAEQIYQVAQLRLEGAHGARLELDDFLAAAQDAEASNVQLRSRATLGIYCRMLARSLAQIVNILDPGVIVLGGGLSNMSGIYRFVRALMVDYVFSDTCLTRLLPPRWGDASGVRGAAGLWEPGELPAPGLQS